MMVAMLANIDKGSIAELRLKKTCRPQGLGATVESCRSLGVAGRVSHRTSLHDASQFFCPTAIPHCIAARCGAA